LSAANGEIEHILKPRAPEQGWSSPMNDFTPTVGQWYVRRDGMRFEVIDIDDGDGLIEVQDEDGTLDEIDAQEWTKINLELSTQPEDATAAFDNVPIPDEADGGDPMEINPAAIEPQRVSNEERVNSTDDDEA
jgi:hypothetical protein